MLSFSADDGTRTRNPGSTGRADGDYPLRQCHQQPRPRQPVMTTPGFGKILVRTLAMRPPREYNVSANRMWRNILRFKWLQCERSAKATSPAGSLAGLKIRFTQVSVGSSPTFGTL